MPENTDALWDLALAQEKNNKLDAAIKTYDQLLRFQPRFETGYYNRGRLKLLLKDYDGAIKDFQRTLQIETRFVDAYNEIAIAHIQQGLYDEALEDLQTAAKVNTTNKIVNSNLAKLQAHMKK